MKIEPVRYSRLIMQLMMPTPIKALRQARNASPSSERRTPGAAAIDEILFERVQIERVRICQLLPMFLASVYLSRVNPDGVQRAANSRAGAMTAAGTPI